MQDDLSTAYLMLKLLQNVFEAVVRCSGKLKIGKNTGALKKDEYWVLCLSWHFWNATFNTDG